MTGSEKVQLTNRMICDFWSMHEDGASADAMDALVEAISTVLAFKGETDNAQNHD